MSEAACDIIDLREARDAGLLEQVYRQLYLSAFRTASEQESLEQYAARLFGPPRPPPQPVTHFLVAGQSLRDPDRRMVDGFAIVETYRTSRCGLLTYIVVAPPARGQGLARFLLNKAREALQCDLNSQLRAIFAEAHDPARILPTEDVMNPTERLVAMRRLGARQVPIHYVQPELCPGGERSRNLLLMTFPASATAEANVLSAAVLREFLEEFYRALGVASPGDDPDFRAMLEQLSQPCDIEATPLPVVAIRSEDRG